MNSVLGTIPIEVPNTAVWIQFNIPSGIFVLISFIAIVKQLIHCLIMNNDKKWMDFCLLCTIMCQIKITIKLQDDIRI